MFLTSGSRKGPLQSSSWPEPLPSPPAAQYYPSGLTSQTSGESNPYISLDSPPLSPPEPNDYPSSPPAHRSSKRRYTFSKIPQSEDTDRFLDALTEQLGQTVAIGDDFLTPEKDYEEVDDDIIIYYHHLAIIIIIIIDIFKNNSLSLMPILYYTDRQIIV